MTNFLILAVMMITLMGAASYGLVNAMRSLQTSIQTLVIEDRLEEATQGVLANIVSVTSSTAQIYYVPAPDSLSTPGVPSWITTNAQTPRGVKFLYCPFSNATGTGASTITTPNSSYTVNTGTAYAGTNVSSTTYVTQSSTRPTNASTAVAIIVAPGANQSALLSTQDCLSVSTTGTLPGATVRIITEQEVQSRAQVTASTGTEFYAASAATNDAKASSGSNYATFSNVMDYVTKYRPQRVTVNLKTGDTITVNAANMDESSVTTREFTGIRNHSIFFNSGGVSLVTGVNGTFTPSILGNAYFYGAKATPVNGQLYRPVANAFGNLIFNSTIVQGFAQADNLGKITIAGSETMAGASATSATGNEMFYMSRGGTFRTIGGNQLSGPAAGNINNTIFYNEFGGNSYLDGTVALLNGDNGTASPFYAGGDAGLYISGATLGPTSGSHTEVSTIYTDIAGRTFETNNSSGFYNVEDYNRGGIYVISGGNNTANGMITPVNGSPNFFLAGGPGAIFGISSNAILGNSTHRPVKESILTYGSPTQSYFLASLIGGNSVLDQSGTAALPALYGLTGSSNPCLGNLTGYNVASGGNANTGGAAVAPTGVIGMEAAIILNRTAATCY